MSPAAYAAPALAFGVTLAAVALLIRRAPTLALDHPTQRSLHERPVPRSGGLGILAGTLAGWLAAGAPVPAGLWLALALVAAVSALDDLRGAPVALRLGVHLAAAAIVALPLAHEAGWAAGLAALLALAWMANLYNFMDGSDGLAGGMALFGFGAYGAAAALAGQPGFALMNFTLAATALAFLVYNFHPARVFMGDAGAVPLGFLAGALGLSGWRDGLWPLWFPLLVFSPFVVDATLTLARRLFRGERVWVAHRSHYYQRLVQLGCGHRGTALIEYALMAAAGASAVWALLLPPAGQAWLLLVWATAYAGLVLAVDAAWHRAGAAERRP